MQVTYYEAIGGKPYQGAPLIDVDFQATLPKFIWPHWISWGPFSFCYLDETLHAMRRDGDLYLWRRHPGLFVDGSEWETIVYLAGHEITHEERTAFADRILATLPEVIMENVL